MLQIHQLDKITFSNGMQDNESNVGTVGSTGLEGNQLTEQNWADFPVGFGVMMRSEIKVMVIQHIFIFIKLTKRFWW